MKKMVKHSMMPGATVDQQLKVQRRKSVSHLPFKVNK